MKPAVIHLFLIGLIILSSCKMTDKEKIDIIMGAEEIHIQQNTFGGLMGYSEREYHLKKGVDVDILTIDVGKDYEEVVKIKKDNDLVNLFMNEAYQSNSPEKEMSASCLGTDSEFIFKTGFTTLTLRPNDKCDSLFNMIVYPHE